MTQMVITDEMIDGMASMKGNYIYPKNYIAQLNPTIFAPEEITPTAIQNAFKQFEARQARYELLRNYYIGKQRFAYSDDSDSATVVSNLCAYIVRTLRGYIIGNRPQYICKEGDAYGQAIVDLFVKQNKWLVDAKILKDMSTFGRGLELVYRDKKDPSIPKSARVSPMDGFVAYAGDIERDSVFGAIRYVKVDENQQKTYRLYVYTVTDVQVWESKGQDGPWTLVEGPEPHGFGRVPLIEYANNEEYMGDFESIIPLQDAYNALLSDRLDDKNAFAQAVLKISGQVLGMGVDEVKDSLKKLKDMKTLQLDSDATADYLVKTFDESGVQIYQDQIKSDIHKLAMVPDLSDEQFANNASGISMAYKMFGTDQAVSDKLSYYEQGFQRRCKLYDAAINNSALSPDYETKCDIGAMSIRFRFNSPQDVSYAATAYTTAISGGFLSKQTAMENLSIVEDAQQEMERIQREQDEATERQKALFEDDYAQNQGGTFPDDVSEDEDEPEAKGQPDRS